MALLYPVLIAAAVSLVWRGRANAAGKGRWWFAVWGVAGFLMAFSFVTGLSIGLFILPAAAVVLLCVATRSPHLVEASGFLAGVAATVLLVVVLNHG